MKWGVLSAKFGLSAVFAAFLVSWSITASAQGGRIIRPQVDLPGGAVRDIIIENCISCHGIDDYGFNAADRAGWQELIDRLHEDKGEDLIADQDEEILLDYLVATFGADSVPFPRDFVAVAVENISEFFDDASARVFLQRTSTSCHNLDAVFASRYTPDRWRAILVTERERGANLDEENLERLVEWLARVQGTNPVE